MYLKKLLSVSVNEFAYRVQGISPAGSTEPLTSRNFQNTIASLVHLHKILISINMQ